VQWPVRNTGRSGRARFFADGGFYTSDGRGRFVAPEPPRLATALCDDYPLRLNTGRIRDQWHTMTRTGKSPRLGSHSPVPLVEVHPDDAARFGLGDAGLAAVETAHGRIVATVRVSAAQQPGSIFVPIHWTAETSSHGRVGALVHPVTDPISGQPDAKGTPVRVARVACALRGFALSRRPLDLGPETWWVRVALTDGVGTLLASNEDVEVWAGRAAALLGTDSLLAEFMDAPRGLYRAATFDGAGRLSGCLFLGPADNPPAWDAVRALFEADALGPEVRRVLLSGRSADGLPSHGPLVCACFAVGLEAIRAAAASGAGSVDEIGRRLKAGTNCGSCRPEIRKILADEHAAAAF